MKVLVVNMTLDPRTGGGTAARTLDVARMLAAENVACDIVTSDEALDSLAPIGGVRIVPLKVTAGRFRLPVSGFAEAQAAVARADVVLFMNHWTAINVVLWRYVVAFGRAYVVCPAGALPVEGGRSRWLKRLYNAVYGRRLIRGAHAHMAVTRDEAVQFSTYAVSPSTVSVVPNALPQIQRGDARRFRHVLSLGEAPFVLFLGRLAPVKGPDLLVEAFIRLAAERPDWSLVVAGSDDGMEAELATSIKRASLMERVRLCGYLGPQEKADALAAAALVAVPSRREAMSIVVLEAGAAGMPVLITDQCGLPEVAESGGGWVVPATVQGLTSGLRDATADQAELARRGMRWRAEVMERYSSRAVAAMYLDVLEGAIGRRRRDDGNLQVKEAS